MHSGDNTADVSDLSFAVSDFILLPLRPLLGLSLDDIARIQELFKHDHSLLLFRMG